MKIKLRQYLFSNIQKLKNDYRKIYDSTLLTKDNQNLKKQLLQKSLLSLLAPTFLINTQYYQIALLSLIYGSIKFSNWIQLFKQSGKYIEQIYLNDKQEIYVILDNQQAFICDINNVQCNLSQQSIDQRFENMSHKEIVIFPLQIKNTKRCKKISDMYGLHNSLFYLVIDNVEHEKLIVENKVLQQILNKMKNPILKLDTDNNL